MRNITFWRDKQQQVEKRLITLRDMESRLERRHQLHRNIARTCLRGYRRSLERSRVRVVNEVLMRLRAKIARLKRTKIDYYEDRIRALQTRNAWDRIRKPSV